MNNPWFIQKTAQHLGYGRFRSKQIQPIAHIYYEINEQGFTRRSLCGKEVSTKKQLLPAFSCVPICRECARAMK